MVKSITIFLLTGILIFSIILYEITITNIKHEHKISKQDSIWIMAHNGLESRYNPQTTFNEVMITDSLGEELLLIKVYIKPK